MPKEFNIVINGVGGQGLITLLRVISETALISDFDVKTSELHGLSQRGGDVEAHLRFGEKVYSPLVRKGGADLIISLEAQESLLATPYASPKTTFLLNEYFLGEGSLGLEKIKSLLAGVSPKVVSVPASSLCQDKLETEIVSGTFLLGYAIKQGILPLEREKMIIALGKSIPGGYLDLNLKAFNLAAEY